MGIRFICFDAYQIFNLIRYFLITERVTTSQRTFYISSKASKGHPIYRFLESAGLTADQKPDREYEDINFIIKFAHPIDRYFSSGLEKFETLAQRAQPRDSEKFNTLITLFDRIKQQAPHLIREIAKFPIECQIVTATQHIYNRTQRPHYEYILQARENDPTVSIDEARDLSERLDLLKYNLLAIDLNVYSIHKKLGIRYEVPSRISPGDLFPLDGRLPSDILGENKLLEKINNEQLPVLINPDSKTIERQHALDQIFTDISTIDKKITDRHLKEKDISARSLLEVADLRQLSHPEIVFWAFQRIVIFVLSVILLYTRDKVILEK